ncbi:hypothetical protein BHM03_00028809 [Ensete ventricosum]|nr:hypothetical protein BHM03_00028809 [Ensete ventricosum]
MASCFFSPFSFYYSFLLLSVFALFCFETSEPNPVVDPHWHPATATWYGSPNGDGSDGELHTRGACGYGSLVDVRPLRARVGAVSPVLFKGGEGCGACYKVRCLDPVVCARRPVTVIVTDECPGGYCAFGRTHFDLSGAAFGRMAVPGKASQLRDRGEMPVVFRRSCGLNSHDKRVIFSLAGKFRRVARDEAHMGSKLVYHWGASAGSLVSKAYYINHPKVLLSSGCDSQELVSQSHLHLSAQLTLGVVIVMQKRLVFGVFRVNVAKTSSLQRGEQAPSLMRIP